MIARSFWPAGEAAQEDYEQLRNAVLAGVPIVGTTADRFRHGGLGDLIRTPQATPLFRGGMVGAVRPAWTPHVDPRVEALADSFSWVLAAVERQRDEREDAITEVQT